MLRFVIALLIAANVLYFLWTLGAFGFLGQVPHTQQHEPQRLERQVRPESIEILNTTTEPSAP
jgi:hypothetical protein